MRDRPAEIYPHTDPNMRYPNRQRCEFCRALPDVSWSTPVMIEDDRTGIPLCRRVFISCKNHYCRARAQRAAEMWPMAESFRIFTGPTIIRYPINVRYLEGI